MKSRMSLRYTMALAIGGLSRDKAVVKVTGPIHRIGTRLDNFKRALSLFLGAQGAGQGIDLPAGDRVPAGACNPAWSITLGFRYLLQPFLVGVRELDDLLQVSFSRHFQVQAARPLRSPLDESAG